MGASPHTRAQPDYKAILQGFYDKQLTRRIAQAHQDAFTNANKVLWYVQECHKIFNAFAGICMQFSNQKKFGEVYGRENYLQPIQDFHNHLDVHMPYISDDAKMLDDAKDMLLSAVTRTLEQLNPSQTNVSDIQ